MLFLVCFYFLFFFVLFFFFFFFNDTATTEIYTLSLHALFRPSGFPMLCKVCGNRLPMRSKRARSEEHTSELQSHHDLVCRLLLEKKKTISHLQTQHTNTQILLSEFTSNINAHSPAR